jgi:hypothetical protein
VPAPLEIQLELVTKASGAFMDLLFNVAGKASLVHAVIVK